MKKITCRHCGGAGYIHKDTWLQKHEEGMCFRCKGTKVEWVQEPPPKQLGKWQLYQKYDDCFLHFEVTKDRCFVNAMNIPDDILRQVFLAVGVPECGFRDLTNWNGGLELDVELMRQAYKRAKEAGLTEKPEFIWDVDDDEGVPECRWMKHREKDTEKVQCDCCKAEVNFENTVNMGPDHIICRNCVEDTGC